MFHRIFQFIYARYRAFAPISCLESPRADVLRGWQRWRWLVRQRRSGCLVEPSVRVQGDTARIEECLKLGGGAHLDQGVIVWIENGGGKKGAIHLAERVYVGPYSYIGVSNHTLTIGEDTMIGAHCYLITENHVTARKDIPYARQGFIGADVVIGKNVWLGCHVTVLPGVTIGDNAIIGAGAVVTRNIPAGETWVGVPARKINSAGLKPQALG